MSSRIPQEHEKEFAEFPTVLQDLVRAELAAGNEIAEFSHGFPAAPCGACILLSKPVTTRPHEATKELDYYDRQGSSYSGEFTDTTRHFFVLEPPHPPEPPPDMDAIRAKLEADYAAANARRWDRDGRIEPSLPPRCLEEIQGPALAKFQASMVIDYDKWKEGEGYDLAALEDATEVEKLAIETLLTRRCPTDWREVEALAALGTPRSWQMLRRAFREGDARTRLAVHQYAPQLVSQEDRTNSLVKALEQAEIFTGLSQALDEVAEFHPPPVMDAMLRGLLHRDGGTAVHLAAMLYYVHGKSAAPFDWNHRPFFLRFHTDDLGERESAIRELCHTIGVDANQWLKSHR